MMNIGSETEHTLCEIWGQSVPKASRKDTIETIRQVKNAHLDFVAACPNYKYLVMGQKE